jgi:hypothetical protein
MKGVRCERDLRGSGQEPVASCCDTPVNFTFHKRRGTPSVVHLLLVSQSDLSSMDGRTDGWLAGWLAGWMDGQLDHEIR